VALSLACGYGRRAKARRAYDLPEIHWKDRAASPRIDEFWCAIGRRGGKSRAMAALAVYLAGLCDYKDKLVRGEKGVVLLLAPDMRQAKVSLDYAAGVLESTPIMRQLLL
jgi:phage terminase large subunit-like protein